MKALIYDYETLGTDVNTCPILTMAALEQIDSDRFITNPYTLEELVDVAGFWKFDVAEQVQKYGRIVNQDTVKWWMALPAEVRDPQLKPKDDDLSITMVPEIFKAGFRKGDLVFTRGNTFDPMITDSLCAAMNQDPGELYPFWAVRDTRSYIEGMSYGSNMRNSFMPPDIDKDTVGLHDPRVDIALDVLRIQYVAQAIS